MPTIKVLHILSDFEPGGAQQCVLDLARYLDRDRFQVHVCCLRRGGALVGKLREAGVPFHISWFGSRLSPVGLWRLRELVRQVAPHVVHTHLRRANQAGRLAALWAGAPVVCAHHHDTNLPRTRGQRFLLRKLAERTDRIFCVSQEVRSARLGLGLEPEERLHVLHNFIEPSDYRRGVQPGTVKAELGLPADVPVVGIVGRLHPDKNHELFFRTARVLLEEDPAVHFAVVGDGSLRTALERRAQELGLGGAVTFTGVQSDMARVYRALDVVVLCSRREGFGKVILEAQAAGVPVVALRVGGVAEVMAGGGGYLLDEAEPRAFAAAIDHALQPEERLEILRQAERNLERFSATRVLTELEDIYTDLCEEKGAFRHVYG
jgi:glycosyltransferase involved in cell wall biosynthesis